MKTYSYTIYRPAGNDTALVSGIVKSKALRKKINDAIMQKNANVEQVGFIEKIKGQYRLLMAGGEFCGNALRSAAFAFLNGKPGEIKIKVSGVKKPLKAGVHKKGNAWAQMPIPISPASSTPMFLGNTTPGVVFPNNTGKIHIIQMPSASQLVVEKKQNSHPKKWPKNRA